MSQSGTLGTMNLKLILTLYSKLRRHCFSNRIVLINVDNWNSLSDHVMAAETLNAPKARSDKLWNIIPK